MRGLLRWTIRFPALLVAVLVTLLTACDDATSPTAPSPPPRPDNGADPRFDDQFWRDLIYNEYSDGVLLPASEVLDHDRNFSLRTSDMPADLVDWIEDAIPRLWREATGRPYAGEIVRDDPDIGHPPGWTTVTVEANTYNACGLYATAGEHSWITLDLDNRTCAGYFEHGFAHEFGHVLGLNHVQTSNTLMHESANRVLTFTATEQYHAQLAYEIGPGAPYCGWPYGPRCQ